MDVQDRVTGLIHSSNPYTIGAQGEYQCSKHENRECTFVCPSCVTLLCRNCLTENLHQNCNIILAQDAVDGTCDSMRAALVTRIDTMASHVSGLQKDLIQKRKRMIRKKNETAFEIELFFSRLKDKLIAKLKKDEQELLKELADQVAEQERGLMTFTELCNEAKTILTEKKCSVVSPSPRKQDSEVMSPFFKYLLKTSHELSYVEQNRTIIQDARDAFLVIRFCVSSEVEKTLLNGCVASVEVLHSRSDNPDDSLETQHIELVSQAMENSRLEASASDGAARPRSPETRDEGRASSGAGTPELSLPQEDLLLIDFGEVDSSPALEPTVQNSGNSPLESTPAQTNGVNSLSTNNEAVPRITVSTVQNERQTPPNTETSSIPNENNSESAVVDSVTQTSPNVADAPNQTQGMSNENTSPSTCELNPDDPPPPYMGYTHASPMLSPDPEDPPPPYPGLSPPPYGHYPPQPHDSRSRIRGRLPGVSDSNDRRSPSYPSRSPSAEQRDWNSRLADEDGAVSPSGDVVIVSPCPLFAFNNGEMNDRRASGIFAMVIHEGYSFLMIDRWNKKLKYFSKDGVSIGGLIFREEPWDLASLGGGKYAITVPKLKTIYKVMASETDLITLGNICTIRKYACVAFHSEREWLVCGQVPQFGEPVIDVLGVDGGPVILSFRRFSYGQNFISYPRFVKVGIDGTCFVCDWNLRCLVVFKLDGTVIGQYRGTPECPLIEPTGIVLNKDMDSVYVIDSKHNCESGAIHKVSLDCQCQRIYRGPKEFRDARALAAFDNKIVIGSRNGNISVYKTHNRYS